MKWVSHIETGDNLTAAIQRAAEKVRRDFPDQIPQIGLLFISSQFRNQIPELWPLIRKELPFDHIIGCTAGGVIGHSKEEEDHPAISLMAGISPGVDVHAFTVTQSQIPDGDKPPQAWRDLFRVDPSLRPDFILISDPFSIDIDALVGGLDFAYPGSIKVGGLASGGAQSNENILFIDNKIIRQGAVGIALTGNISLETVVAQGCRPIGKPLPITAADNNILISMGGKSPLEQLQHIYEDADQRDRDLMQHSLFMGIVMDSMKGDPGAGDFLIRNIIGVDQERGVMALGSYLRPGQIVQFHLRDSVTSHEDLKGLLEKRNADLSGTEKQNRPTAAILFSCMGRGKRLYGTSNHDTDLIREMVGTVPVGGFFCNGEIGPIGGRTFVHGYTSSIALIRPAHLNVSGKPAKKEGKNYRKKGDSSK